ncbi:MAG: anti-sigma factor, partial [Actinomycetota bacterium]
AALFGSAAAVLILVVGVFAMASRTPAPDWETTLAGTDVSPTASAVLAGWNTAAGTRLVLEASDLEPAPEGFVYQLWFSKGHQHISAGTFADPSRVELTVGIARNDFPEVWISLDPTTPGSTGTGPAVVHTTDG